MKRYTHTRYRGNSRGRTVGRILLVAVLAVLILLSLLVLGNLLRDRLQRSAHLLSLPIIQYESPPESQASAAYIHHTPRETPAGTWCAPDPAVIRGGDSQAIESLCRVAAELYEGISVTVAGEGGLRFVLSQNPGEKAAADDTAALRTLTKTAGEYGLRTTAVWQLPDSIPGADSQTALSAQMLAEMGFDEILFTGLSSASLSERDIASMTALSDIIKLHTPSVLVGFALESAVFAEVSAILSLEELAAQADFIAVDAGMPPQGEEEAADFAKELQKKLYGSIAYYPLRVLLRGSASALAAQTEALREVGVAAIEQIY